VRRRRWRRWRQHKARLGGSRSRAGAGTRSASRGQEKGSGRQEGPRVGVRPEPGSARVRRWRGEDFRSGDGPSRRGSTAAPREKGGLFLLCTRHPDPGKWSVTGGALWMVEDQPAAHVQVARPPGRPDARRCHLRPRAAGRPPTGAKGTFPTKGERGHLTSLMGFAPAHDGLELLITIVGMRKQGRNVTCPHFLGPWGSPIRALLAHSHCRRTRPIFHRSIRLVR
jgi:hypothetical protein